MEMYLCLNFKRKLKSFKTISNYFFFTNKRRGGLIGRSGVVQGTKSKREKAKEEVRGV
jgi:hypothetical protein